MKTSIIFTSFFTAFFIAAQGYTNGSICRNGAFYEQSCISARASCLNSCPTSSDGYSTLADECDRQCDNCTIGKAPNTLEGTYSDCMGKATSCQSRSLCIYAYNNGVAACNNYVKSASSDGTSFSSSNCGSVKPNPAC